MIKKLKARFIVLSMTSLFALLSLLVVGMNLINYTTVVSDADQVLALLSKNKGTFSDPELHLPHDMSPETPYESRYFSVYLNSSGSVINTETSKITSVDSATAIRYAQTVTEREKDRGFIGKYRYLCYQEPSGSRIVFLDCGRNLQSFRSFLTASVGIALGGLIAVFFVIFFFAGRIIRPIAESYEKQKRFITDAGHEIKTPLTIINANVDVLEMELDEGNEFLEDVRSQAKRLTSLTNDLVLLARMEEAQESMQKIDFPLSEVVADAALPFRTPAQAQGKEFLCSIQPTLTLNGNGKAIQQLVSILMDNALKYSPTGGTISLTLEQRAKTISLTVFNTTDAEIRRDQLSRVFDRFYRTDSSRNSETGGHGIGLSVAKAIVTAHGGKIQASSHDGRSFCITALFPA